MKVKLKDICEVKNGYAFKSDEYVNSGIRVIRITNVQKGFVEDENPQFYPVDKIDELAEYMLNKDDLLISLTGNVGRVAILGEEFLPAALNQRVGCLRVLNSVKTKYLFYYLLSKRFEDDCIKYSKGIAQKNMSTEWLKEYELNIAAIEEQDKTVQILDTLQNIIFKYNKLLKNLDTLIKARFVEMFGTLEKPVEEFKYEYLENLCIKITDGKHGGCDCIDNSDKYFIGAKEIYDGIVHYDNAPKISNLDFEKEYKRCNAEIGDLFIVNTGATIGKSAIAMDIRTSNTLLQKSVALIKADSIKLNTVFLQNCYSVNKSMYYVESSSAQPNLLLSRIKKTEIYVPPIELQNEFASYVQQVEKMKMIVKQLLYKTQTLFDSLMQNYFGNIEN